MGTVLLVTRLSLALVFLLAGLTKLADRTGSVRAVQDFGVSGILASPLGVLVPLAEIGVALALIPTVSAWWGAIGALLLLLSFCVGIGVNLARGRTPECHCFGQLHSEPVSRSTLIRNGALAAIASFVVWQGRQGAGGSAISWIGGLTTAERVEVVAMVVIVALVAAEAQFLIHLLKQNGRLLVRLEAIEAWLAAGGVEPAVSIGPSSSDAGLPIGIPAPGFMLPGLHGETVSRDELLASGSPLVLLFSNPGCGPCASLLPEIGRWQREHAAVLTLAVVSRGTPETNRLQAAEHGLTRVLLQQDHEVAEAYEVLGTPSALLVRADGMVGSRLAIGSDAIRSLIKNVSAEIYRAYESLR